MSFEIKRDNTPRSIKTDTIDTQGDDEFAVSRDPFVDPPKREEELGMEFLVDEPEDDDDEEDGDDDEEDDDDLFAEYPGNPDEQVEEKPKEPELTYEEIQKQKGFYLSQLNRIIKRGVPARRLGMEHSLEEIRGEVFRVKKEAQMDAGIDYCRQGLMFCVSTIEMANGKFKLGAKLDGWSQAVMGNIENYDEVFEELYEKYFSKTTIAPELKLISMLAGSAFMFHLQQSMMEGKGFAPKQREMEGPNVDTDELLRQLNQEVDLDDISSIDTRSNASSEPKLVEETKKIPIPRKKRGRPKKN
jgi:hypothetical protein